MDPVTIVSLVGTCLALACKGAAGLQVIYNFYGGLRNAPELLSYLISDVENADLILRAIKEHVLTDGTLYFPKLRERIGQCFEMCELVLKRVVVFAETHQRKAQAAAGRILGSQWARFRFTWSETEIKSLRNELLVRIQYLDHMRNNLFRPG
jgi:hypothetical protein